MRLFRIPVLGGLVTATLIAAIIGAPSPASAAPPVLTDKTPGVRTGQAEPVKPALPTNITAVVETSADEIKVRTPRAGGGLSLKLYHLVPGADAKKVLANLRTKGAVPAGTATEVRAATADWQECSTSYGSAKYLCAKTSPHYWYNWRWNGFDDPQVYFRDYTPAAWPVKASVAEWNKSPGVDSYWTTGACPTGGRHCVPVRAANSGANGIYAETDMEVDSVGFFIDGTVRVDFNNYYSSTDDNRGTACHELGHALGLAHNGSTSSCLYNSAVSGPDPRLPHSTDISVLRYILYAD
ncbi:hypothetical protein [Actinoplanes regularis]|uniref:hypothetical protein n=1 Tax=Actinoplanes regularis TaxID=52697 RepID=UPI0024A5C6FF|nr:hypothetical protein [Actinoplanes regularis]GLW32669.1 hypothetical protein Areg01_56070 [Actinoplanes regularis]